MWLSGNQTPGRNTINSFRSTHLKDCINEIFTQVVSDDEPPTPIDSETLKKRIAEINRENLSKEEKNEVKLLEEKHLPKLQEYEEKLDTLGNRNS
jgi:hypothetical protein